ncbi:uncharacterized protein LOC127104478 [Lathyrus oleraceus]|uniref:uncharacterized protein LOC127104478 n=1 Tax=Pisum sativum TaxID=3888 RepID=UPI0021D1BF20|nr:uncharacterized protein LOC127104478 [Pisum sativum]
MADDDWWVDKSKEDPNILKWKHGGPKFIDLLDKCFKGATTIGFALYKPYEDQLPCEGSESVFEDGRENSIITEDEGDAYNFDVGNEVQPNPTPSSSKKRKVLGKGEKIRPTEKLQRSFDRILDGMCDNSNKSLGESSDDSSYESDNTSEIDIEVQQVNRSQYHIATVMVAFMVTNHVLKYIVKEKKTTSILSGQLWFIELITGNDNRDDNQCWSYFKDCIGAIDGTHIEIHVPAEKQKPFFNRKGHTSTNVMALCDFNMCFTFALCGWEGYVHDAKILMDTLRKPNLRFPYPTKYSGYPSLKGFLAPYKNARYHLTHSRLAPGFRSRNENFNYYHSCLKSVIERTFGVVKARWKVLQEIPNFKLQTQTTIIWARFALYNFLRRTDSSDLDILESLENINGLQDNEQDFHEGDENGVPTHGE